MGQVLRHLGVIDDEMAETLTATLTPTVKNWAGTPTGQVRPRRVASDAAVVCNALTGLDGLALEQRPDPGAPGPATCASASPRPASTTPTCW